MRSSANTSRRTKPPLASSQREVRRALPTQSTLVFDEAGDLVDALADAQIAEHERPCAAHAPRIALHHRERSAHVRRKIDLVDHEQVGARDARATLGWDLVAGGDVDDV